MKTPVETQFGTTEANNKLLCPELQRLSDELGQLLTQKTAMREQIELEILDPAHRRATLTLLTGRIDQVLRSIADHEKQCDCV